ncbi:MAG: hypothetical protein ABW217_14300 [Polyangiaceae bacterium]
MPERVTPSGFVRRSGAIDNASWLLDKAETTHRFGGFDFEVDDIDERVEQFASGAGGLNRS